MLPVADIFEHSFKGWVGIIQHKQVEAYYMLGIGIPLENRKIWPQIPAYGNNCWNWGGLSERGLCWTQPISFTDAFSAVDNCIWDPSLGPRDHKQSVESVNYMQLSLNSFN